jgi:hypothetical protein
MIIRIANDIRFFLLVLLLVLLGFSQAFWLLSSKDSSSQFGTVPGSLLNSFLFMLGNFNADFEGTASPVIATIILVQFLLFMSILMLNLLIALMGESFNQVSQNGLGQWRLELAATLIEQRHLLAVNEEVNGINNCMYVIKYTSELEFDDVIENHEYENQPIGTSEESHDHFTAVPISGNAAAELAELKVKMTEIENQLSKIIVHLEQLNKGGHVKQS